MNGGPQFGQMTVGWGQSDKRERRKVLKEKLRKLEVLKASLVQQIKNLEDSKASSQNQVALHKPPAKPSKGKQGAGKGPGKRPLALPGPSKAPKKQKPEAEKRVAAIWAQCSTILKNMKSHKNGHPFSVPVDPVKLGIPDYYLHIKHPMDLGTINKRLEDKPEDPRKGPRKYQTPLEFRDDVRLVFANCRNFNPPGQPVRNMGDQLSDFFEKKWAESGIEQKWEEEKRPQEGEVKPSPCRPMVP